MNDLNCILMGATFFGLLLFVISKILGIKVYDGKSGFIGSGNSAIIDNCIIEHVYKPSALFKSDDCMYDPGYSCMPGNVFYENSQHHMDMFQ